MVPLIVRGVRFGSYGGGKLFRRPKGAAVNLRAAGAEIFEKAPFSFKVPFQKIESLHLLRPRRASDPRLNLSKY